VFGADAAWVWLNERAATWIGPFGFWRRRALYGLLLPHAGTHLAIAAGALLRKRTAEIGDYVYVGAYALLGDVRIGDSVLIAAHVVIPSGSRQHGIDRLDVPVRAQQGVLDTIHIGDDTWIGAGAIVLADVGAHCVVGAGSVVTRPVPDYAIVAGNPARQIGDRRERSHDAAEDASRTMPA
jgi:acetyltransferase-like isoleucine patch superfamily enzyme